MRTTVLIDGHHALRRAYHAMESLTDPDGNATGGTFGFLAILKTTINTFAPHNVIVMLDGGRDPWRLRMHPGYKDRSDPNPEKNEEKERQKAAVLHQTLELTERVLPLLGIPFIRLKATEADDLIYIAEQVTRARGDRTVVVSGDKDFYQMVCESTVIYDPMTKRRSNLMEGPPTVNVNNFMELTGVRVEQYLDLKAMCGDHSDRIPGIYGVGDKTAAKWLTEFGSFREILKRKEEFNKKGKKAQALIEGRQIVARNLLLMGLRHRPLSDKLKAYVRLVVERVNTPPQTRALREYCASKQAMEFVANMPEFIQVIEAQRTRSMNPGVREGEV